MILTDYSGIGIAAVITHITRAGDSTIDPAYGKHLILNSIRNAHKMFGGMFGDHIIACDKGTSWRKKVYVHYKANRNKSGDSKIKWEEIYKTIDDVKTALADTFPCWVVEKHGCEADDIIGSMARSANEPVLIYSRDKDFHQLLVRPNILQFRPIERELIIRRDARHDIQAWAKLKFNRKKKVVAEDWAANYLKEHIIRGDGGDGVPNSLSDDDTFVVPEKRQKPMTMKQLERLLTYWDDSLTDAISDQEREFIKRNMKMIDLSYPNGYCSGIIDQYYKVPRNSGPIEVKRFLIEHRLMELAKKSSDFFIRPNQNNNIRVSQFFDR